MRKLMKKELRNILGAFSDKAKAEKAEYASLYLHLVVHTGLVLVVLATVGIVYFFQNLNLQAVIAAVILYIILILWVTRKYRMYRRTVRLMVWGHKERSGCEFDELLKEWKYVFLEGFVESDLAFSKEREFKIHFSLEKLVDEITKIVEQKEEE